MFRKWKKLPGFTLIEALVTMLIGGILFLTVGIVVIYTHSTMKKAENLTELNDEYRYVHKKMEYLMRHANTQPYVIMGSGTESDVPFKIDDIISGSKGRLVQFETFDQDLDNYVLHQFRQEGEQVRYRMWTAGTGDIGGVITKYYNTGADPTVNEIVLRNTENLEFTPTGYFADTAAVHTWLKHRKVINPANNTIAVSSHTFTVESRNVKTGR